jgi:hypothetical protein
MRAGRVLAPRRPKTARRAPIASGWRLTSNVPMFHET